MRPPAWWGNVAPKGTPAAAIAALNEALDEVLADPGIRDFLAAQGYSVGGATPADRGKGTSDSIDLRGPVVKQAGIVLE